MKSKKRRGVRDIEEILDHLEDEYKKRKREEWIKEHYSSKKRKTKGGEK